MNIVFCKRLLLGLVLMCPGQWAVADDDKGEEKSQVEPIELIINFRIAGQFTGATTAVMRQRIFSVAVKFLTRLK